MCRIIYLPLQYTNKHKTIKIMYKFISHLRKIESDFIKYAKSNSEKLNLETLEISICNGYLSMRCEGENEEGETIVFSQEIEPDGEGGLVGLYVEEY